MTQHIIAAIFILLAGGVIGGYMVLMYLVKFMDDHKEESECSSDQ